MRGKKSDPLKDWSVSVPSLADLKIKIFADCADPDQMIALAANPLIKGFTTNPTLMRAAGVTDYERWAKQILEAIPDKPISMEVTADGFGDMHSQAEDLASWGDNVYVKIPITNTKGESSVPLVKELADLGIKVNVTAICDPQQAINATHAISIGQPAILSIFAGRIADTGRDPSLFIRDYRRGPNMPHSIKLLWASAREILNIYQADAACCDIITVPPAMLKKAEQLCWKNLSDYSLETVQQFYRDAQAAGLTL